MELETIHQEMLDAIDDRYQKTAGFPAYDLTRAFALAAVSLAGDLETAEAHLDIAALTGTELDDYVLQHRGLARKYGTYATATLRLVAGAGAIEAGALFSTASGVEFMAITDGDYTQGDTFPVRAYEAGARGNVAADTITYLPVTIGGISAVTNDAPATGGYDGETDDQLRERYYEDLANPNNGSNQQAYMAWAQEVPGVGRAKVFPQANGPMTVEVCIVGADMAPASASTIGQVQTVIDPNSNGDGSGTAPIGAICTVTTATALTLNLSLSVTKAEGASTQTVTAAIREKVTDYLKSIAFKRETTYVSYSKLSQQIAQAEGVLDHSGLTVNGGSSNVALGERQTPVLGEVTLA